MAKSLFDTASKGNSTKASSSLPERQMSEKLNQLGKLMRVLEPVLAFQAQLEKELSEEALAIFVKEAVEAKASPSNFIGVQPYGRAQYQIAKRPVSKALDEAEQALLTAEKIPFGDHVKKQETFIFNPVLVDHEDAREAISQAFIEYDPLSKVLETLELKISDIIQRIPEEKVKTVTPETLVKVYETGDQDKTAALLPICTTLRTKYEREPDMTLEEALDVLEEVKELMEDN